MQLSDVIPWGRSLDEYTQMFALTTDDLAKRLLGCGDGPASFNAELSARDGDITSVDPIYRFDAEQIRVRINAVYPEVMAQLARHRDDYVWTRIESIEALGQARLQAMHAFLEDYAQHRGSGRYIDAALPALPFADDSFDLAVCSHYLFLYSAHVSQHAHLQSMVELCRVAHEVRVYPLLSLNDNRPSPHLEPVMSALTQLGITVSRVPVDYEFQKGATEMLVARRVE